MIVIVCGLPGTGKSFFSNRLAQELKIAMHNTDQIRKKLELQSAYSETDKSMVYSALLGEMVDEVQRSGSVLLDGTFHKASTRKRFLRMAASMKQPVLFIKMEASPLTVQERMSAERQHSEADFSVYRKVKKEFDALNEPHLVLQSDKMTVDEMLEKAKEHIYEQA
jgi:predicted kinase